MKKVPKDYKVILETEKVLYFGMGGSHTGVYISKKFSPLKIH